ncbi:hypothetical protein fnug_350 [Pseudomonas phage fnug]|uniref:Uncharacterized protein n=3 Tax=Viruses TaxID=10239 RepID=A0A192Y823_9CAUD|nr:hypothetical protein KTN4_358 [Pseudomonas phage KTN4]QJB22993.1 hypothetical protein fnug_350 [Pseudomonas phage fnug]USL86580.1 hypothetical protein CDGHABPJ_00117 [Pseudomonas phage OMKO1]UXD83330.1 hypothetical protein NP274_00279 [Pseudomonas phage Koomba boorn-mokiny kep-wari Wadjak 1]WNV49957.1 hypothetical protein [Pseudomonas phage ANB1]
MNNTNQFVKTIVDYQAILDALIYKTNENWNKYGMHYHLNDVSHITIRDHRTVGFFIGRQSGSTTALMEFSKRYPGECLAVFTDERIRRGAQDKLSKTPDNIIPYLTTFKLRSYIHKSGLSTIQKDFNENLLSDIRYILVDNASYNLNLRGITDKEFNQWVADTFGTSVIVVRFS